MEKFTNSLFPFCYHSCPFDLPVIGDKYISIHIYIYKEIVYNCMSIFLGKKSIVACLEISQTFQLACFRDDQHGNGKISMHKNKL